ncbi:Ankyrin repeat domain-containing 34B [Paramuricea clavata]|uniref:Ankyrin repeat domain-containing 34B n=1 Tax=Paramuricea clavata TaxID=317549 RepID=A0A7D9EVS5_PARCT|nr:Ankyrin repeat domain-containing 34B [Paramuricea clavata]
MEKVSERKRTYVRGKPLGNDLRSLIIDEIIHSGGNIITREYPGNFFAIAKRFSVHDSTVNNIWSNYCENKTLDPKKKKGGNPSKLRDGDLELIETLTRIRPTISLNELKDDLKFFDEAGLKLPHHGTRYYGHAPEDERCIELARYHQTPNITLNLLAGLEGVVCANTVKGAASSVHLLQFFGEAAQAGNVVAQRPALEYGPDIVVMDNCPTYHYTMAKRY